MTATGEPTRIGLVGFCMAAGAVGLAILAGCQSGPLDGSVREAEETEAEVIEVAPRLKEETGQVPEIEPIQPAPPEEDGEMEPDSKPVAKAEPEQRLRATVQVEPVAKQVNWPFVRVLPDERAVEIDGFVATTEGWLEQIICNVGTRDYEAIIATQAKASHIHAGLLLLGLEPGHPGSWQIDPDDPQMMKWEVVQPEGPKVWLTVQWTDEGGQSHEVPVQDWVRDHHSGRQFPDGPWVFGGSMMATDYQGREVYVADRSGSICGLVTFGDETLGWNEVWPDQVEVRPAEWEADTDAMPVSGTPVVVHLATTAP